MVLVTTMQGNMHRYPAESYRAYFSSTGGKEKGKGGKEKTTIMPVNNNLFINKNSLLK